jgi:hypothetical protein
MWTEHDVPPIQSHHRLPFYDELNRKKIGGRPESVGKI